jgi:glycosyltransferase involved in cell wall biosynthesis
MYPSGGAPAFGKFVQLQVEALRRLGCEQEVMIIRGRNKFLKYVLGFLEMRKRLRTTMYSHLHAYYGLCGFIASLQTRVPVVVTYCGSDLNSGYAGTRKARLRSLIIFALSQFAAWRASVCIVRSREMLGRILSAGARRKARIIVSGLNLDLFRPDQPLEARRRLGWEHDKPIILFVCSDPALPAVKRPELALAVANEVRRHFPSVELKVVAGQPQESLPDYYNAADVLLLTSANEGSPNVVREALACNLPVVSTRVGDVPDLLAGLNHCHVRNADPVDLASAVAEVLQARKRISSRDRVRTYSLDFTSQAILRTYTEALAMHADRREMIGMTGRPRM